MRLAIEGHGLTMCHTKRRMMRRSRQMKKILILMASFASGILNAADLKVGDAAPDFALQGSDGKTYKLSEFRGKQAVVIAWYPKAFTGG